MKKTFIITSIILLITFLSSCASKEKPVREPDETFIADINSFEIGTFHLYTSYGMGKPKICDYTATFYPRSNYIYFLTKVGIDKVQLCFSYNERKSMEAAKNKYLELYESGQIKREKPNKKNSLSNGNIYINWGAIGPAHQSYAPYYTNIEFILENKPYFRIMCEQSPELDDSGNSSPRIFIYISPAQWEQICQICDQERLVQMANDVVSEANEF